MIDPEALYRTEEAAALIKKSPQTLKNDRVRGKPPRFYKHNGRVLYKGADLIASVGSPLNSTSELPVVRTAKNGDAS